MIMLENAVGHTCRTKAYQNIPISNKILAIIRHFILTIFLIICGLIIKNNKIYLVGKLNRSQLIYGLLFLMLVLRQ